MRRHHIGPIDFRITQKTIGSNGFVPAVAVLASVRPLFRLLPRDGLIWLLAGAFCYTGGVLFFVLDSRLKFAHSVWHVFVLAGSACQFVAITWYA